MYLVHKLGIKEHTMNSFLVLALASVIAAFACVATAFVLFRVSSRHGYVGKYDRMFDYAQLIVYGSSLFFTLGCAFAIGSLMTI